MKEPEVTQEIPTGDVEKMGEIKESRKERRLKESKQEILNKLVSDFFLERSPLKDLEGDEAAKLFVKHQNFWINECMNFNRSKNRPFTLRKRAFEEQVEHFLNLEKKQKQKVVEDKQAKDFNHWYRGAGGKYYPILVWYWIISAGNREKYLHSMKNYYIQHILVKNV